MVEGADGRLGLALSGAKRQQLVEDVVVPEQPPRSRLLATEPLEERPNIVVLVVRWMEVGEEAARVDAALAPTVRWPPDGRVDGRHASWSSASMDSASVRPVVGTS